MTTRDSVMVRGIRRLGGLLGFLLLLGAALPAYAINCSEIPNHTLDGFAGDVPPSQIQIDTNCYIRNYPASNPLDTNFSFLTQPGQTDERWIIIFDNVVHTGEMACNSVAGHKIWFTNGSSSSIQEGCQNLLIPVEKIDKANPPGDTATIGVPFTYRLTMPVLFDPATQTVINNLGSQNDLHGITVWDDLNATGVDLTYVSHTAYWEGTGTPVSHTFSNNGGLLTFDNFPIVPANDQIVLEITVVLEDTPNNTVGTQFINTAKWDFGRLIDGVFYEPLPGEWGISPPMTIGGPDLVVTKTGPATLGRTLNLGEWGEFALDVHNAGLAEAWDVTVIDRLPNGPTGGMCDLTPELLSVQVVGSDGVTPVPGKDALAAGTDFTIDYAGAPSCQLTFTALSSAAMIGADEHLIISYRTRLDTDSQDGASLTNIAGATEWFNGDSSNPERQRYARTVSNGSVGVADHQDAHTTTVALRGYFFEKTVANLTQGTNPATTASPGDRLRYTLRLQATEVALADLTFRDDMGALNPSLVFVPGSLQLVPGTLPAGAVANISANGGTNGAGIFEINNVDVLANSAVSVQFDITLDAAVLDGTVVTNQAELLGPGKLADSDDPNVNGQANPDVPGDEDPTRVLVETTPPSALVKANTQATAAIGEVFSYRVTVPSAPHDAALYDVRILDDLTASAADLEFVGVSVVSGPGGISPVNTGTATNLVIEDTTGGIDLPAGTQLVLDVQVALADTPTNVAGLSFINAAAYTYDLRDSDPSTRRNGDPGATGPMTIVEPELTLEKSGPPLLGIGTPGLFTLNVHNVGTSPAHGLVVTDVLPNTATGGMCDAAPTQVTAGVYEADGVTPVGPALAAGSDFTVTFNGDPACTLTLTMTSADASIGVDQRLIVQYQAELDAGSQADTTLTNVAGATEWESVYGGAAPSRTYARTLSDGTVGVLDHEDAHTLLVNPYAVSFQKVVSNVTTQDDPATLATPGDTLHYSLYVENIGDTVLDDFQVVDELDRLNGMASFQPGTLNVISAPAGADVSATNPTGGTFGSGVLEVRNLSLGLGETAQIEFEVQLGPVLANGSYVENQSQVTTSGFVIANSDDPNVNGADDPNLAGDEDPTRVLIQSAPAFDVNKTSADLDGDPDVLLAGERLRYTITVQNVGNDNATDATIRDQIPASTTYVAGSTMLNGNAVADTPEGLSPLVDGMPINSPADNAPGHMTANAAAQPSNVAVITFDVTVYPDAADGTVISNQGFVSAPVGGVTDQPSDDPDTPVVDDPTRDVVGSLPLLYAEKYVVLQEDFGTVGVIDPGDVLRYTIRIFNNGAVDAMDAVLTDDVPANTTYVTGTTTLNGEAVTDGGAFPLAGGLPVSSTDLTPPLPGPGEGVLTAGEQAVVQFDLRVDDGVATGTLISNQALVTSVGLPNLLTDGDGDPATGPEPTVVVVGPAQQLSITKEVAVVGGGPVLAGSALEYTVRVRNIGNLTATGVRLVDNLDDPLPGQLTFDSRAPTLNGSTAGIVISGSTLTVDYGDLAPGGELLLRFVANVDANLAVGTSVTNMASVYWNDTERLDASATVDVGAIVGVGILNGSVWHDADFDNVQDPEERPLPGWTVELHRNGQLLSVATADADGHYRMSGIAPNYLTGDVLALVFRAPGAGASSAKLGVAYSADFTNELQRISDIVVQPGSNLMNLDLPIDPNGVVYDAVTRVPVAGVALTLVNAAGSTLLPSGCFDDPAQQGQVTRTDGYYKFDLNFSDPSCPSGGAYAIRVQVPGSGYTDGYSEIIPPAADATAPPFNVPFCPGSVDDVVPTTADHCELQVSEFAPGAGVAAQSPGTRYYVHGLTFDGTDAPGSSQVFNNHIPVDPVLDGVVSITKTTPAVNVTRGQMVPYTITVTNTYPVALQDVSVVDRPPPGFSYIEGSARVDGEPLEPTAANGELTWSGLTLNAEETHTIQLLMGVGAGVTEGEYVNRAQATTAGGAMALSGEATATVRLVPDPTFDCTDVIGKVYDDGNRNGIQDSGETGLAGVRLVTANGLAATTDQHGRFHITCAVTPREDRGSNFVLKLDDRTLPSGFRSSTDTVQVKRATRGKALKFNFGASIHRVVGLEVADAVFEPDSTDIKPMWQDRFDLLLEELQKGPAVLRLTYLADLEDPKLVDKRVKAVKREIADRWRALDCCYELELEHDVFWRLGAPAKRVIKRSGR